MSRFSHFLLLLVGCQVGARTLTGDETIVLDDASPEIGATIHARISGTPTDASELLDRLVIEPEHVLTQAAPGTFRALAAGRAHIYLGGSLDSRLRAVVDVRCPSQSVEAVIHESTEIQTDETWDARVKTHVISGPVRVHGATLTIQNCTTVSFQEGAFLEVGPGGDSKVIAIGSREYPIRFASAGTSESVLWDGIRIHAADAAGSLLHSVEISGARGLSGVSGPQRAVIDVVGDVTKRASVPGLELSAVKIEGCPDVGVRIRDLVVTSSPSWREFEISGCRAPITVDTASMSATPKGIYVGNLVDEVEVIGGPGGFYYQVWDHPGVPYRVKGSIYLANFEPGRGIDLGRSPEQGRLPFDTIVSANVQLRFEPPNEEQPEHLGIFVGMPSSDDNAVPTVLSVQGTSAEPVVFTSASDAPHPGDWVGLVFYAGGVGLDPKLLTRLHGAVVEYAGAAIPGEANPDVRGAVVMYDPELEIPMLSPRGVQTWILNASLLRCNAGYGLVMQEVKLPLSSDDYRNRAEGPSVCICDSEVADFGPSSDEVTSTLCPCSSRIPAWPFVGSESCD